MKTSALIPRAWERQANRLRESEVVVLLGGRSSEREVSLVSGAAVLRAFAHSPGDAPRCLPRRVQAVELEPRGTWKLDGASLPPLEALRRCAPGTLFFLALHGGEGEDGRVQGLLEMQGLAHTGSGVAASALCMDKSHTKAVLAAAGLRVARECLVHPFEWHARHDELFAIACALAQAGAFVKPNRGGSSVATFALENAAGLAAAIEAVLATGDQALVEERIRGSEATCAVLGNADGELHALTPVEIVPRPGKYFDYQEKYSAEGAQEHCPPRSLSDETCERIRGAALRAHRAAGCDGYSRTDFLVPRDAAGHAGEPVVLEINTLPGLTARSLLPQAAAVHGFTFPELCLELLALALERWSPEARA